MSVGTGISNQITNMNKAAKTLFNLYKSCNESGTSFVLVLSKYLMFKIIGNNILAHHNTKIVGIKNIETHDLVRIGLDTVGFGHGTDLTFLNIRGKLKFAGKYLISRGCRFDIGPHALVRIGKGGYVSCNTKFIIMHRLTIGSACAIAWNCQFLDEDFHSLEYDGKNKSDDNTITIGNHVWIGSNTTIYKGVIIPDECVVAANSVVKGQFEEKNVLIAGNPAKIIKRNVIWS